MELPNRYRCRLIEELLHGLPCLLPKGELLHLQDGVDLFDCVVMDLPEPSLVADCK